MYYYTSKSEGGIIGKSEGVLQVKVVFFNISMFFTKKKKVLQVQVQVKSVLLEY